MPDIEHYIGNAEVFPILRKWDFFNHAAVSPLPQPASQVLCTFADQAGSDTYLVGTWYRDIERLRVLSAKLLDCHRDEIAFVKNTGEGLSIVASGDRLEARRSHRHHRRGISRRISIRGWNNAAGMGANW